MGPRADSELAAAARGGDKAAFAALVERHLPALLSTCRRALRDDGLAADAAQDAVVAALLSLDRLREDDRFGAWLLGIGLNFCRRALRARARAPSALEDDLAAREPSPADAAESAWVAQRVREAIAGLPAGQREAVTLFYLAGLSQAEVAEHLGTPAGAVKTRLHKARAALRGRLTDVRKEDGMDQETTGVPMRVADVRRTRAQDSLDRLALVLEEQGGDRRLLIWIGDAEAMALGLRLEAIAFPRPGTYELTAALLGAAGAAVREVRVTRLTDMVFYGEVVLENGAAVDARPSDALNLALVVGAPISVDVAVLEEAARTEPLLAEESAAVLASTEDAGSLVRAWTAERDEAERELEALRARAREAGG